jgi:prevent-host-death family protein
MLKTVSATQARIHFGELMQQAQNGPIVVERDGRPEVVILSKQVYDELATAAPQRNHSTLTEALNQVYETQESSLDPALLKAQLSSLENEAW